MATQVKHRRGTAAEIAAFVPALAEIIFNTTDNTLHIGNGVIPGGVKQSSSRVNVKQFGAVGDGVTNDYQAIQSAINFAQENGLVVFLPAGKYYIPDTQGLIADEDKPFYMVGTGKDTSVILFDNFFEPSGSGTQVLYTGENADGSGACVLMDFAIEGKWGQEADFDEYQGMVRLNGYDYFYVSGFKVKGSRSGGLVSSNSDNVVVVESAFEDCYRDSCRFENAKVANISNNYFKNIQDDCIALPTSDTDGEPVDNQFIIDGNNIVDSQGIITLGGKTVVITNNNIVRPIHRAIKVGQSQSFTEGRTSGFNITIANNNIRDGFNGQVFSANSGGGFDAIEIACKQLLDKDTVETGSPVVTPYPYYYLNDTSDSLVVNAGMYNINVVNNNIVRTLDAVPAYVDYGFGTRLSRSGYVNPAITLDDLCEYGIHVSGGGGNGMNIAANTVDGFKQNVKLQLFAKNIGVSLRNYVIQNNILKNFREAGCFCNFNGFLEIKNNLIDGDPYHEADQRNADGSWNASYQQHRGILFENPVGTANGNIQGNTFKNVGVPFWQQGFNVDSITTQGNVFVCDPAGVGYLGTNKGIGFFPTVNIFDARLVVEDSDPTSGTFKDILNVCQTGSAAQPASGKYPTGHIVYNTAGSTVIGWKRLTFGSNHVAGVDWHEF